MRARVREELGSDLLSTFAVGGGAAFVARVLGALATLLLYLLLARVLGEVGYGRYVYALNWVAVLVMVANLGLDTASFKFLPMYATRQDLSRLRGFVRRVPPIVGGSGLVVSALLAAAVSSLRGWISPPLAWTFYGACSLLPLLGLLQLAGAMLRGQQRVLAAIVPRSVLRPVALIAAVGVAVAGLELPLSASSTMLLDALVTAAMLMLSAVLFRRGLPEALGDAAPVDESRAWLRTALPLMAITSVKLVMNRTDILMVGMLVDTTASGVYALASQMTTLIGFPLMAGNVILAPLISERHADDDREGLQHLVTFAARSVTAVATLVSIGLVVIAPWVLAVFGPAFGAAYGPLLVLVLGQLVNAAAGAVGFLLSMTGHERVAAKTTLLSAILNVALNAALISWLGLLGAAVATLVSGIVWNVMLVYQTARLLGIRSTILA